LTSDNVEKGSVVKVRGLPGLERQIVEIVMQYNSLPDYRTLSFNQIRKFYSFIIPSLKEMSKETKK
jgi:hypothetical protein